MKSWKKYINYLKINKKGLRLFSYPMLVLFLLCSLPLTIASDCVPDPRQFYGYSFVSPRVVNLEAPAAPFFLGFEQIYALFGEQTNAQTQSNIAEWRSRYCNRAKEEDIHLVVYGTDLEDLKQLQDEMRIPDFELSYPFQGNTFANYLKRHGCFETVDYLMYAKRCEKHAVSSKKNPWKTPKRDTVGMRALLNEGKEAFNQTQSHYIKLRYAYQIIRLAHYAQKYGEVLSLYDLLMPQIDNDPSVIEYWIEGHRAGALMSLGRNVEASYIFSKIFENCPGKAESAFRSFRIRTDQEWEACLLLCKTDKERAALYALRAHAADSKAIEEMQRIYDLDPENTHLEILLLREIKKLEKDLLGYEFNDRKESNKRYFGVPRPGVGQYLLRLQKFVQKLAAEKQVARPALWAVADGYLEVLSGDYYEAERSLKRARNLVKDKTLREQLDVFELALKISAYKDASDAVEQEVDRIRKSELYAEYSQFADFLSDKMTYLYLQGNYPGKAFLSQYRFRDLKVKPDLAIINDLLAICRKPTRTSLENELVLKSDGNSIEKDLLDIKATFLFSQGKLDEALAVFKEMDRDNDWDNFGVFNPFIERFKDCVDCTQMPDTMTVYNKGELIERLISMETRVLAGSEDVAIWLYQLGLAYYNMSYFSYAWPAMDHFRSGTSLSPAYLRAEAFIVPHPAYPLGNIENFDCSKAKAYFDRAREVATDPELAARATYYAAKCERNEWYLSRHRTGAPRTDLYFSILRDNYAQTDFFKRTVRECKTFRAYILK